MKRLLNGLFNTGAMRTPRRSMQPRLLAAKISAALLVLASLMAVWPAGSAGATGGQTISCKKFAGNVYGDIVFDRSSCSPKPPAKYGNLAGPAVNFSQLTWKNGDFISIGNLSYLPWYPDNCNTGWTEYLTTGTVTASSSDPYDSSLVGGPVMAFTCVKVPKIKPLIGDPVTL